MKFVRRSTTALFILAAVSVASASRHRRSPRPRLATRSSRTVRCRRGSPTWAPRLRTLASRPRTRWARPGRRGKAAVPALIENLSNENGAVRYSSTLALGEIGPDAAAAVPALQKALDDRNDDVSHMAKKSLKLITGESVE